MACKSDFTITNFNHTYYSFYTSCTVSFMSPPDSRLITSAFCAIGLGIVVRFDGWGYGLEVMGVEVKEPATPALISPEPNVGRVGGGPK